MDNEIAINRKNAEYYLDAVEEITMKKSIMKYKKTLLFVLIGVLIICLLYVCFGKYIKPYTNPVYIKAWIISFGRLGYIVFIILQILQVVISIVPGEVVQGAGGYIFGTTLGTALSIFGIMLGSIITFLIARYFGNKLLVRILPEKAYMRVKSLIDRPKNRLIIFILFLIPGIPKDILGYASGVTPIKLGEFILFSTIARIPGVLVTSYVGSNLYYGNYTTVIAASIVMVLLLIVGALRGERVIEWFK
jgi:uncharacterized membrane protein YdjX (TVP38/TMEM64 family)